MTPAGCYKLLRFGSYCAPIKNQAGFTSSTPNGKMTENDSFYLAEDRQATSDPGPVGTLPNFRGP